MYSVNEKALHLSKEERDSMLEAAKPLIKWINDNVHPMCSIAVTQSTVTLSECIAMQTTSEFVKD